ncbi:MAG TPA: hypothetical protein DIT13_07315 [Verrucomicrobiales bacterium]|nr:hypothetical protein [Verrucomicrobiales bacterium]HRJ09024.1 ATP-binding protein [Prosthecobacter sp.]HRK15546.1 ATP-binding protein [Prosthecobacter sp.]
MAHTINLLQTTNPDGIHSLLTQFPSPKSIKGKITIKLGNAYLYSCVFPIIAAWRKSLPDGVEVEMNDNSLEEAAKRLLQNVGIVDIVEQNTEAPALVYSKTGNVPLQPIVRGHSVESTVNKIYKMVDEWAGYLRDISAFRVILTELCENVLVHSGSTTPGYLHAKVHRSQHGDKCEITIADSGIGIRNSYLEGTNEEVKQRLLKANASAVEIALDGLNSSKPREITPGGSSHFGYGLFTIKRLIELNRGHLTVVSGDEFVTVNRFKTEKKKLQTPWSGTIISLLLDLANPLPLEDVYEEEVSKIIPEPQTPPQVGTVALVETASVQPAPSKTSFPLLQFGTELLTREIGLAIRAELATTLLDANVIEVDLDGIVDIMPSVADEVFGKLSLRLGVEKYRSRIIFRGGTPVLHRLIDFVVAQRAKGENASS